MLAGSVTEEADHTRYGEQIAASDILLASCSASRAERCDIVVVDTPPGLGPDDARDARRLRPRAHPAAGRAAGAADDAADPPRHPGHRHRQHERLVLDGILLTMYEEGNPACETTATYIREKVPAHLMLDIVVPRAMRVAEAFAAGQPAVVRRPADPASQAYVNLATRLAERLGL